MLASVYKSTKKDDMYLYIPNKDDFSQVPEALLKVFGKPQFAIQINLGKREKLARVDIHEVKESLKQNGFFLQMPPVVHTDFAR